MAKKTPVKKAAAKKPLSSKPVAQKKALAAEQTATKKPPASGKRSATKKTATNQKAPRRGSGSPTVAGIVKSRRLIPLHILSDSTGNLPQHMLTAFLTQFPPDAFALRRWNFLQTLDKLRGALEQVAEEPGIVCHAMVDPRFKALIVRRCEEQRWPQCDLTGEFVQFLSRVSGIQPSPNVAALHDTAEPYHNRIRALEFTLEHDDGLGLDTIHRADIVLAGVSRTSKTPTSIYLAQQGYRVANVSLAMEVEPPHQLLSLKRGVVGLLIDVRQLVEIRTNRNVGWRMGDTRYNDPDHVDRELIWSKRLFARHGWPALDVTDQAVEETAARVVNLITARARK